MTPSFINLSRDFLIHLCFLLDPQLGIMNFLSLLAPAYNSHHLCSPETCSSFKVNPFCLGFQDFMSKSPATFPTPFVISCTSPSSPHICRLERESFSLSCQGEFAAPGSPPGRDRMTQRSPAGRTAPAGHLEECVLLL